MFQISMNARPVLVVMGGRVQMESTVTLVDVPVATRDPTVRKVSIINIHHPICCPSQYEKCMPFTTVELLFMPMHIHAHAIMVVRTTIHTTAHCC